MNPILSKYYGASITCPTDLEVENVQELKIFLESFYETWIKEFKIQTITSFFNLVTVYPLDEEFEEEVYNFDIKGFLRELHR